jgi:hypothetical protein
LTRLGGRCRKSIEPPTADCREPGGHEPFNVDVYIIVEVQERRRYPILTLDVLGENRRIVALAAEAPGAIAAPPKRFRVFVPLR